MKLCRTCNWDGDCHLQDAPPPGAFTTQEIEEGTCNMWEAKHRYKLGWHGLFQHEGNLQNIVDIIRAEMQDIESDDEVTLTIKRVK